MRDGLEQQLGANIKAVRTAQKLTQERLAEQIGKSIGLVGQIERGEAMPSVETLLDIIGALGVAPDTILGNLFPGARRRTSDRLLQLVSGLDQRQQDYVLEQAECFCRYLKD